MKPYSSGKLDLTSSVAVEVCTTVGSMSFTRVAGSASPAIASAIEGFG